MKSVIMVEPVGKARPRATFNKKTKKIMTYTPQKTAHAENQIRDKVMELEIFFPKELPLRLEATFFRVRPKRLKKSVRLPVTKPDWDNYGKLLCDALEKFVYANDSQISTAVIKKRFGSPPRIELLMEVDNE